MKNNIYCVYSHSNSSGIFYVGSGTITRAHQWGRNKIWSKRVFMYDQGEYKVNIVADDLSRDRAFHIESHLIKKLRQRNISLTNRIIPKERPDFDDPIFIGEDNNIKLEGYTEKKVPKDSSTLPLQLFSICCIILVLPILIILSPIMLLGWLFSGNKSRKR